MSVGARPEPGSIVLVGAISSDPGGCSTGAVVDGETVGVTFGSGALATGTVGGAGVRGASESALSEEQAPARRATALRVMPRDAVRRAEEAAVTKEKNLQNDWLRMSESDGGSAGIQKT